MVYFGGNRKIEEIDNLDEEEFRIVIPQPRYFILATSRLVRTNVGVKRRIKSGRVTLYHFSLEELINQLKQHKNQSELDLIKSVMYENL